MRKNEREGETNEEDMSDFVCDGDCENCPVSDTDCIGDCAVCPCKGKCEDAEEEA